MINSLFLLSKFPYIYSMEIILFLVTVKRITSV